jgi:hypothetical protein
MKRNKYLPGLNLKGFQPLHFTWQPWQKVAHPPTLRDSLQARCNELRGGAEVLNERID